LEKAPHNISVNEIHEHICRLDGIIDVHHIHIWSLDGQNNFATMHIVTNAEPHEIKEKIREELREHGISHVTLELENDGEHCHDEFCHVEFENAHHHHHHHHH